MKYYSHVLNLPHSHPFDTDFRWTTFLGEFVKPLTEKHSFLYWFSYYGDFARFRIYTDDYDSIFPDLESLREKLGLTYKMKEEKKEEHDLTLEGDLGNPRFLGKERSEITPTERGLKILKMLNAGCELFLHTLIREGNYWREEKNEDLLQNPFGSSSHSYIHLLHNLCQSDIQMVACRNNQGRQALLQSYYFSNALAKGQLPPQKGQEIRIPV